MPSNSHAINVSVLHDQSATFSLPGGYVGDYSLTSVFDTSPAHGVITPDEQDADTYHFTPDAHFAGTDSADYTTTASFGDSSNSDSSTVTFNVTNTAPTASDASFSIGHDQVLTGIDFATDADSDSLTYTVVSNASHGTASLGADGKLEYAANPGWTGTDTFTAKANDGVADSDTVTITVSVTNTAPTGTDGSVSVEHDTVLTGINLNQYFTDDDGDPLTVSVVYDPIHGTLTQNDDGTYIYTPNANYIGSDTFTIVANDGATNSDQVTVSIDVTQFAPLDGGGEYSVVHDHVLSDINFASNTSEANGNPAVIEIVSGPSHGTLTLNEDSTYDYTPNAHYVGTDTVTITVEGGTNVDVTINVTDEAPVAWQTSVQLTAHNQVSNELNLAANFTDADDDTLTVDIVSAPAHGSLDIDPTSGLYVYHASTGYVGLDSFSYRFFDGAMYSQTVTCEVLVYDDSVDMNSSLVQDSEEAPPLALYDNALPTQGLLQQGRIDCCWLVASVASLLRSWRNWVKETLVPPANADGTFTVNFPGNPITVSTPIGDGNTYSPGNGDGFWLSVLEKAAGQYYYNQTYWAWPYTPYDYINEGKYPQYFIPVLTGDAVEDDYFRFTNDDDTANRLTTAFNNNKVVVASTFGSPAAGLIPKHSYGVVGWDAETNQVTLYNPHGSNPNYTVVVPASGNQPAREETRNLSSSGDGYFTMPLYQFTRSFSYIDYEL